MPYDPYLHMKSGQEPEPEVVQDMNAPSSGRDPAPVSRAIIHAVLNKKPQKEVFQPALSRTPSANRYSGNARVSALPKGLRLESPGYPFKEIDKVVPIESMVMRAFYTITSHVMPGVDSFYVEGANDKAVKYIERRFEELTAPVGKGMTPYDLVRKIVENVIKKSNAIAWFRRERNPKTKYRYLGVDRAPIKAIEIIDVSQVDVVRNENDKVMGYNLSTAVTNKLIRNKDCFHITYQRVSNDHLFGCPFVIPVLDDILSLRRLEEMLDMALGKATFPLYHLAIGDEAHPPDIYGEGGRDNDIQRAKDMFNGMAPEGTLVTPGWYKLTVVQPKSVGDFKAYLDWYRDRIFMGLLMDGPTMGIGDSANRNTANSMSDSLLTKVRDIQAVVANQITSGIIRELLVEGGFDPIGEDAVYFVFKDNDDQGRRDHENQIMGLYQGNVITHTEARRRIGLKPMSPEDLKSDTFLSYSNELSMQAEASKAKATGENKAQPKNQHGKSASKPKAAKRKDFYATLMNTVIAAYDTSAISGKAVLSSQSNALAAAIISDLSLQVSGTACKTDVQRKVQLLVKNIADSINPKKRNAKSILAGLRYKVEQIFNDTLSDHLDEPESDTND